MALELLPPAPALAMLLVTGTPDPLKLLDARRDMVVDVVPAALAAFCCSGSIRTLGPPPPPPILLADSYPLRSGLLYCCCCCCCGKCRFKPRVATLVLAGAFCTQDSPVMAGDDTGERRLW